MGEELRGSCPLPLLLTSPPPCRESPFSGHKEEFGGFRTLCPLSSQALQKGSCLHWPLGKWLPVPGAQEKQQGHELQSQAPGYRFAKGWPLPLGDEDAWTKGSRGTGSASPGGRGPVPRSPPEPSPPHCLFSSLSSIHWLRLQVPARLEVVWPPVEPASWPACVPSTAAVLPLGHLLPEHPWTLA